MKAIARRREGYVHDVEVDTGFSITVDEPVEQGGTNTAPSPTRLLAAALASCTAITIEMYTDRKEWDLGPLEVEAEWDTPDPGEKAEIELRIHLPENLTDEQVERILRVARKCPVARTLSGAVEVNETVERR